LEEDTTFSDYDLQKKEEELDDAAPYFDLESISSICPYCAKEVFVYDLGLEGGDQFRRARHWFRCSVCNNLFHTIIENWVKTSYFDFSYWKKMDTPKRRKKLARS